MKITLHLFQSLLIPCILLNVFFSVSSNWFSTNVDLDGLSISADLLHIYFINLDQSTDRRKWFESNIARLPDHLSTSIRLNRVAALTGADVWSMVANGTFVLNGVDELVEPGPPGKYKKYTRNEVACTLSHLKAIQQAYYDGHESVLILEDDAVVTAEFLQQWQAYSQLAPVDWNVLQWTTNNAAINKKESHRFNDFWLTWFNYHWSTIAYTIRRDGMKRVLDQTSNIFDISVEDEYAIEWRFKEPNMIVADELIFFTSGSTYTSSHCWFVDGAVNSTFASTHAAVNDFGQSKRAPSINQLHSIERPESIAVIQNTRIRSAKEIKTEVQRLNADIRALSRFHSRSMWFVNVVFTSPDLQSLFQVISPKLPENIVQLTLKVSMERFNKFTFVHQKLDEISDFDRVLFKDSDIKLAGFEWNTFLNSNRNSIVSGPYRVDIEDTTTRHQATIIDSKNSTSYVVGFQDGNIFNSFRESNFQHTLSSTVMTLEMFMVLMRSDFAVWFFSQALTSEFVLQDVDWGPDLMWCAAAHDFRHRLLLGNNSVPCSLTSVNVLHMDTRQIPRTADFSTNGDKALEGFRNSENPLLRRWVAGGASSRWHFHVIKNWCKTNSKPFQQLLEGPAWKLEYGGCLDEFHRRRAERYESDTWGKKSKQQKEGTSRTRSSGCAVIYSSGSLLKHEDGSLIDSFEHVIRINRAKTIGFEKYVGNKTTIRAVHLFKGGSISPAQWFVNRNETNELPLTFNISNEERAGWHKKWEQLKSEAADRWIMAERSYEENCNKHVGYPPPGGPRWCSSGTMVVLWATQNCDAVTLFGLDHDPCYPYHYGMGSRDMPSNCSNRISYDSIGAHNFLLEERFLKELHNQGNITINRFLELYDPKDR